jgi:kynurenine formamidase
MEAEEVAVVRGNHEEAARRFCKRRGAALNVLPSPDFFVNDEITCSSHAGTHVDAPWHFGPTVEGRPAKTIDQVPLEWFYGDGVLLDFSRKKPDDPIAAPDLVKELDRIGYTLKPEDIVLLRTGAEDHFFDDPHFQDCATGLTGDAFLWLLDQGIRTLGTDAYTLEMSFEAMLRGMRNGDPAAFFPVHRNAVRKECCQAVKLCNLKEIPHPIGFKVALFPTKLEKGSAGWARAVAILL